MSDRNTEKPVGKKEIERLRRRVAELEERLENAENLYAELLGLFESETGRRKSILSEITRREKELERRELQLRTERVLNEIWHHRDFYDALKRVLLSQTDSSMQVLVEGGKYPSAPAKEAIGPWIISGSFRPDFIKLEGDTLRLRPDCKVGYSHLWIRLSATNPALIQVYFHSGRIPPREPSEHLSIARDGVLDFFLELPDVLPQEILLKQEGTGTTVEIYELALMTPSGMSFPGSQTTLRLYDWMAPERGERISDNVRRKPFANSSVPLTLFGDGEVYVEMHANYIPLGEKLLWLRLSAEYGGAFRVCWNQERDDPDAVIEVSAIKVDVKDSGNFRDYAVPLPFSRIDGLRVEFQEGRGKVKLERAELWQFPGHRLSPDPLCFIPAIFSSDGLSPWISHVESERGISFMDGDFIYLTPTSENAEDLGIRRLVSPPLDISAEAFIAEAVISHQYETRARLLVDFGEGFFVPDGGQIEFPPGNNCEAAVRFDGGRLRQIRWEFDLGISDTPLKIHRLVLAASLKQGTTFTLVPRCMHWDLFEPLLDEIARKFPGGKIVVTETNFDNFQHYPAGIVIVPYEATSYIADELAAYLANKLIIPHCGRLIIPVMNPDGKGYEEFFRFGKISGIEEILIIEVDGRIGDAPV